MTVNERLTQALAISDRNNEKLAVRLMQLEIIMGKLLDKLGITLEFEKEETSIHSPVDANGSPVEEDVN
jgi:hypothetical protein